MAQARDGRDKRYRARQRQLLAALDPLPMYLHTGDDCPLARDMRDRLEEWGFAVIHVRLEEPFQVTAPPAMDERAIHCVDIDSLGETAFELVSDFCGQHPDAGVITMTAQLDDEQYRQALQAGATEHIQADDGRQLFFAFLRVLATDQRCRDVGSEAVAPRVQEACTALEGLTELPTLQEMDRLLLAEALRRCGGVIARAARLLGVTPQAIHNRQRRDRGRDG